ncbi:MAG: 30S ribosome-binding factor RbfA [Clostridiales bacterium]|jgi:ribosome-binding factor A|nr:30S ribosome-binding factor RbfA [Clostridiales bacterium]
MAGNRISRINEEVYRVLSELIRELKDPRICSMVTVMSAEVTNDQRWCKVYVSVMDESREKDVMKGLRSASGFLRRELGSRVRLRITPELVFIMDDSIKRGARINELLNSLEEKNGQ